MASRQFFEPMSDVLLPLDFEKQTGAQGRFMQPSVVVPPGWGQQSGMLGSIADALGNAFMQQREQKNYNNAVQGLGEFWPTIQATGGNEKQINALLASGMSPKEIAHFYLSQEAERANKGYDWQHEASIHQRGLDEKSFTPDQMDVVQDYMQGKVSLSTAMRNSKLTPLQLHEAVGQMAEGVNLQKSSFDLESLPQKQQQEAHHRALEIAKLEHEVKTAPDKDRREEVRLKLEAAQKDLNERRFQWEQQKELKEGKALPIELQKKANTFKGLATAQAQYTQAIKMGLQIRRPNIGSTDVLSPNYNKNETKDSYYKDVIVPALQNQNLESRGSKSQGSIPNTPIGNMAQKAASKWGVDPDLFGRLVRQESGWNNSARSPVGAIGLTQLMPETAKSLKVNANDPEQNLQGGARYLRSLIDRYKDTKLALVAYNGGDGAVRAWQAGHPYKESIGYVNAILGQEQAQPMKASIPKYVNKKSIEDIWSK